MDRSRIEHILEITVVPIAVLIFCGLFYQSAMGLPNLAFSYPQTLILTIVAFVAVYVLTEVIKFVRRGSTAADDGAGDVMAPKDMTVNVDLLVAFGLVFATAVVTRFTGLSVSTFAMMVLLFFWLFRRDLVRMVIISSVSSALFYGVFVALFDLPLDRL